jgi:nucleoredoxin
VEASEAAGIRRVRILNSTGADFMLLMPPALVVLMLSSTLLAVPATKPGIPDAQEVLNRWIEVSGGQERYEALKARQSRWTYTHKRQTAENTIVADDANRFRATLTGDGATQVASSGFNGTTRWEINLVGQIKLLPKEATGVKTIMINPVWPIKVGTAFSKIVNTKAVEFGGEPCWRLMALPKEGSPVELFFSKNTGDWRGCESSVKGSGGGEVPVKFTCEAFQSVDGLKIASRIVERRRDGVFTMILQSVVDNPEITEETFALPPAVLAKVKALPQQETPAVASGGSHAKLISMIGPKLVNAAGQSVDSSVLAGKENVLLYFSAKWCPPCRKFTPTLVDFFDKEASDGDFTVVLVSSDRTQADLQKYMKDYGMNFLAVPFDRLKASGIKGTYGDRGIPNLVVLDAGDKAIAKSYVDGNYVGPRTVLDTFTKSR